MTTASRDISEQIIPCAPENAPCQIPEGRGEEPPGYVGYVGYGIYKYLMRRVFGSLLSIVWVSFFGARTPGSSYVG
jgi:hypothetical protein